MWTNVDQCAPVARAHAARPSPVRQPPCASGRGVQSAADGRANRNAAHSVNWLGDGGLFDTPLTRQSASQKFNRDEIEEGVEVLGHGAPVSATLAHRLTEFARGSSALPPGPANSNFGSLGRGYGALEVRLQREATVDAERAHSSSAPRRTCQAVEERRTLFLPRRANITKMLCAVHPGSPPCAPVFQFTCCAPAPPPPCRRCGPPPPGPSSAPPRRPSRST